MKQKSESVPQKRQTLLEALTDLEASRARKEKGWGMVLPEEAYDCLETTPEERKPQIQAEIEKSRAEVTKMLDCLLEEFEHTLQEEKLQYPADNNELVAPLRSLYAWSRCYPKLKNQLTEIIAFILGEDAESFLDALSFDEETPAFQAWSSHS